MIFRADAVPPGPAGRVVDKRIVICTKLNQVNHPLLCGGKTPGLYLREIPSVVGALPVVESGPLSGRERSGNIIIIRLSMPDVEEPLEVLGTG